MLRIIKKNKDNIPLIFDEITPIEIATINIKTETTTLTRNNLVFLFIFSP